MTTVPTQSQMTGGDRVVLHDVSWRAYETLLEEVGDRSARLTYSDGSLEIMSPGQVHENWKGILGKLIETLALELGVEIKNLCSTTLRREDLEKGLEPDECYYIQHEEQVRGLSTIDLTRDPPPDLAVEIDITHRAIDREAIYAALGVPELWRFDGRQLIVQRLDPDGRYQQSETSVAFPSLRAADLSPFLKMVGTTGETSIIRSFRDWVRDNLVEPDQPPA